MDSKTLFKDFSIDPYLFYEAITGSTDDYVYITNIQTGQSLVSENMFQDFDLPGRIVDNLIDVWGDLIIDRDKPAYYNSIDEMLNGITNEHNVEYQIKNRKNEYIWVVCRGLLQRNAQGDTTIFAGIVTNLGNKRKIDPITGLFLQSECALQVGHYLEKEHDHGGILLLGLDDFSRINALNDHIFGNNVLRQFAQDVLRMLPQHALMFRFDGDEFAIFYPDADAQEIYESYQKLHAYCNSHHFIDGVSYYCSVSGGAAILQKDADNYLDLIKYASCALDASKKKGKNTCTFFSSDLIQAQNRSMEISDQLSHAIVKDMENFEVHYQPLTNVKTRNIKGAEALLRWKSDTYGVISLAEFIPLLESSGWIIKVGKWVLEQAIRTCKKWTAYLPDFVMNVNVSYLQMLDSDFIPFIQKILKENDLKAKHIVIELTESYFVTDMEALKGIFQSLRLLGIQIAMDDFGTGYSSLGMLAQMPADIVKIDRLFINAIHDNTFNLDFIGAVIRLCHSVGIKVTIEGVEDQIQWDTVCNIHADCIQGFYISRPIAKQDFERIFIKTAVQS